MSLSPDRNLGVEIEVVAKDLDTMLASDLRMLVSQLMADARILHEQVINLEQKND